MRLDGGKLLFHKFSLMGKNLLRILGFHELLGVIERGLHIRFREKLSAFALASLALVCRALAVPSKCAVAL